MAKPDPSDDARPSQLFSKVSKLKDIRAPQGAMPAERVAEIADKAGFPDRPVVYGAATGAGEGTGPRPRRPRTVAQRNVQRNLRMTQQTSDLIDAIAEREGCLYQDALERAVHAYAKAKGLSS